MLILLLACVHHQESVETVATPAEPVFVQLADDVVNNPQAFVAQVREARRSPQATHYILGSRTFEAIRAACETTYADPAELTIGTCEVISACEQQVLSPKLDCSCLRCMRLFSGQVDLLGCETEAASVDISHSCNEAPEEPND